MDGVQDLAAIVVCGAALVMFALMIWAGQHQS
jgi:hypothetical protein